MTSLIYLHHILHNMIVCSFYLYSSPKMKIIIYTASCLSRHTFFVWRMTHFVFLSGQNTWNNLQNMFVCVCFTEIVSHTWNDTRVCKWWPHFHFWMNKPFKYRTLNEMLRHCTLHVDFPSKQMPQTPMKRICVDVFTHHTVEHIAY